MKPFLKKSIDNIKIKSKHFALKLKRLIKKSTEIVMSNRLSATGFVMIVIFVLIGIAYFIFGNHIVPYNPLKINLSDVNAPPSIHHLFGTDQLARDIFSRVIAAIPVDIGLAIFIVLISALVGLLLGTIAGYFRGIVRYYMISKNKICNSYQYKYYYHYETGGRKSVAHHDFC